MESGSKNSQGTAYPTEFRMKLVRYAIDNNLTLYYNLDRIEEAGALPPDVIKALREAEKIPEGTEMTKAEANKRFNDYIESIKDTPGFELEDKTKEKLREVFYEGLQQKYKIVD